MADFSHLDEQGRAQMVDVSPKRPQFRRARAEEMIELSPGTRDLIREKLVKIGTKAARNLKYVTLPLADEQT